MKLLVDDRWFGATGIGRFANEILQRAPSESVIECLSKTWAIKNPVSPLLLGLEVNRRKPDLFWTPGFMPPMNCELPFIVTVHDLIHLKYGNRLQVIYFNKVIRPLLKKAAYVFTVSEYSRREILNWTDLPPEKVVTIYNAVSSGYTDIGAKFNPGYQYLLYVGNKRYHKNLRRLLEAFARADLSDDIKMVLTGDATSELLNLADELNISGRLVFLGFVNENDLPSVYREALAVMFVSLYEGFGIPLIEGMACGVPVLASNSSALPEISGGAAYLVDPHDVNEISSGIEKVVGDKVLREKLINLGKIRSLEYSWDRSSSKAWKVFASASQ